MATEGKVTFRRIRGKIVPIRAAEGARVAAAVAGGVALSKLRHRPVESHGGFSAIATGTALLSGIVSGATFFGNGAKGFLGGLGASIALDSVSTGANAASFAGTKGARKDKVKAFAAREGFNIVAGNAAFAATLLAMPSSRKRIVEGTLRALGKLKGFIR